MARILTIVCVLLAGAVCQGQSLLPSSGAVDMTSGEPQDHAWISLPVRDESAVLLHLPPGTGRGGVAGANLATKLTTLPDAIAAHARKAFLCFAPERGSDQTLRRRVLTISAKSVEGTDQWAYTGVPRLELLTSIEGEAQLLGFEATSDGLYALLMRDTVVLERLVDRAWERVAIPEGVSEHVRLVRMDDGLVLIDRAAPIRIWTQEQGAWTRAESLEAAMSDLPRGLPIVGAHRMLAWVSQSPSGELRLAAAADGVRFEHGEVATPDEDVAFFTNGGTPSVVVVTRRRAGESSIGDMTLTRYSIARGARLNEAPLTITGPVSGSQFVLVVVMLGGVLMMVLTFVFWPEQPQVPALPDHLAVATSSRRLIAGSIDLAIGVVCAALIVGVPIRDVVLPGLSDDPLSALNAIVIAIGIASAHSAVLEALAHRSVGKMLIGLHVHAVEDGGLAPMRPWEAVLRNVVRWWLAPVALAGLCRTWRHVGDLAARTIVTQAAEEEEEI